MNYCWYADASEIVFLDLDVREFRVKKDTMFISALDLSVQPRAYYDIGHRFASRDLILDTYRRFGDVRYSSHPDSFFNKQVVRSLPLIEVFRETERISDSSFPNARYYDTLPNQEYEEEEMDVIAKHAWLGSFFCDFSIHIFGKLSAKWEPQTLRLYLKHLKAYTQYIESSLFFIYMRDEQNVISCSSPYFYSDFFGPWVTGLIMRAITPKLLKLLFNNVVEDSRLVAEFFHAVNESETLEANLFFKYDYEITDFFLRHLKRAKCNITNIYEFFPRDCFILKHLCLTRPKHLMMHLNSGVKNMYELLVKKIFHLNWRWHSLDEQENRARDIWILVNVLSSSYEKLNPRESAILTMVLYSYKYPSIFMTCLESQRIIWRSIPDPSLTYQDMKDMLAKYVNEQYAEDKCDEFQKEEFDCFESVLQPRSLSHYCRCIVRDALICNSQMPEGIGLLGLSARQQSYIRLEF